MVTFNDEKRFLLNDRNKFRLTFLQAVIWTAGLMHEKWLQ